MVHYKSYRIVDGDFRWVIEENGNIVGKFPLKEQIKKSIPMEDGIKDLKLEGGI